MKQITLKILVFIFLGLAIQSLSAQEESFKKTFKMEGRIMYDFNFLSADSYENGDAYSYAGNEFRRVRWATKGKVAKNVGFKVEIDLAGGAVNFRDVYLKFALPSNLGSLKMGSFTEPSSLNNMTSSKYITFFERSMMSNTQPFKYNAGMMYSNNKLLDGKMGVEMSYTFAGNKAKAFVDKHINEGANFVGRVYGVAYQDKEAKQVVHLGANFENRVTDDATYGYKYRIENHMGDKFGVAQGDVKNAQDIGFELATTFGPISIQGEYEMATINTNAENDNTYTSAGYYAFASYFITGETRPYKKGSFGRVKPKKAFCLKDGGFGALELVARYSGMDYNDYPNIDADKNYSISNVTAGFNWYLNNNTRIMYNFTSANTNDIIMGDSDTAMYNNLVGHLIRFQVDF